MSLVVPLDSIVELTRTLVRVPSVAGRDGLGPMVGAVEGWLTRAGVPSRRLGDSGRPLGLVATLEGREPGLVVVLDACLDTAPVGERAGWSVEPFGAEIVDGRLFGRGVADSKVAIALFAHLAAELAQDGPAAGTLHFVFDGDEHTGTFGGIRQFLGSETRQPDFVAIGYPGNERIVRGARGFYRATLRTYGSEGHSGGAHELPGGNAIVKMAHLVARLSALELPASDTTGFPLGPRLTVTAVEGGRGFSQVPGLCRFQVDIRLTPHWDEAWARELVAGAVALVDREFPTRRATSIQELESWPAYELAPDHPAVRVLEGAASLELGRPVGSAVAGPSNIGNLLAVYGIPATAGFGVTYGNLHAADEWIALETVAPVYRAYRRAVAQWSVVLTSPPDNALASCRRSQ